MLAPTLYSVGTRPPPPHTHRCPTRPPLEYLNAFLAQRVSLAGSSLLLVLKDDQHEDAGWVLLVLHDGRPEQSRFRLLEGPHEFLLSQEELGRVLISDEARGAPTRKPRVPHWKFVSEVVRLTRGSVQRVWSR